MNKNNVIEMPLHENVCHLCDKSIFIGRSAQFLYLSAAMRSVSIEIPLPAYDSFVEQFEESSPEYEVLKNGLIYQRSNGHDFESFVKIDCALEEANKLLLLATKDCALEEANKLLLLATKVCPDVAVAIAKGITNSLKSD